MKQMLIGFTLGLVLSLMLGTSLALAGGPPGIIHIDLNNPGKPVFYEGGNPSTPGPDIYITDKDGNTSKRP